MSQSRRRPRDLWLLAIGLGPMGAAFYLWDRALRDGDPRVVGTLAYLTPLLSTLLIALVGQGRLGATSAAAMGLIVGGAVVGTWAGNRSQRCHSVIAAVREPCRRSAVAKLE